MVVDRLAATHSLSFSKAKFKAAMASGRVAGQDVILVKPQTFMNLSGEAVGPIVRYYKREPSDLLVIYDDVDIPLGTIRLRAQGGAGGHKGMKSIISNFGEEFSRLRVGVGGGEARFEDLSDYVLGKFTSDEQAELERIIQRACEAVEAALTGPFDKAMTAFN